jgi:hypothetical protein
MSRMCCADSGSLPVECDGERRFGRSLQKLSLKRIGNKSAPMCYALRFSSYSPPYAYVNLFPTIRPITRER